MKIDPESIGETVQLTACDREMGWWIKSRRVATAAGVYASGEALRMACDALGATQSGARMEGGALEIQERNCAATAMVVRWSRRTSLECRKTKAEDNAKAIRRMKVTAAKPRLGTSSRSPEALSCLGR